MTEAEIEIAPIERIFWRISGADAAAYLQGQLSQEIDNVDLLGKAALLLDPTGKVVALLRIRRDGDGFVIDTDAAAADATEARLRRFLLRVDVVIERLEGWDCVRAFTAPRLPQAASPGAWPAAPYPQDITGPDARAVAAELDGRLLEVAEAEERRIRAGMPVSGVDIGADTIPAEIGAWAIEQAVSFTKGCYTGQELVARIDSRGGNVPRPLRGLVSDEEIPVPADVSLGDKVVGRVTSAAAQVALASVSRTVEPGTTVDVVSERGTVAARVVELPIGA